MAFETYRSYYTHYFCSWLCLGPELVIIDRVKKITQVLARSSDDEEEEEHEPTDEEIQDEVSICFNSEIVSDQLPTSFGTVAFFFISEASKKEPPLGNTSHIPN
jgi:hypothetical protein